MSKIDIKCLFTTIKALIDTFVTWRYVIQICQTNISRYPVSKLTPLIRWFLKCTMVHVFSASVLCEYLTVRPSQRLSGLLCFRRFSCRALFPYLTEIVRLLIPLEMILSMAITNSCATRREMPHFKNQSKYTYTWYFTWNLGTCAIRQQDWLILNMK